MIFLVTNFKLRVSWSGDRISRDQNRRSRDQDVKWQPGLLAIWWNSIYRSFPYEKISIILSFYLTWFKSCKSLLGLFSFVTDKKINYCDSDTQRWTYLGEMLLWFASYFCIFSSQFCVRTNWTFSWKMTCANITSHKTEPKQEVEIW